jgi:branched-chain amino acid transport system ATP-binding protein
MSSPDGRAGAGTARAMGAASSPRAHETLVAVRDLDVHYGTSHVLRGTSFTVASGEAVGLLGRNGMGKTTLLRAILGLVRASGGTIAIRGRDTATLRPHAIARLGLGYVPEGRGIFPDLTVRENLAVAARRGCDGRDDWTLARVLATFPRIAARLRNRGDELSGGEQQMLAIGRALMTNPDVLILDEATEGLAPRVVREIWAIVSAIRATGIASVIVDRNVHGVVAHADRVVVMEKGRIVLDRASADAAREPEALARLLGV